MSNQIALVPTFCLYRVEPEKLVNEFNSGAWNAFIVPKLKKSSFSRIGEQGLIHQTHGSSPQNESFSFNNRANDEIVFVTTNNPQYKTYHVAGNGYPGGECRWCRLKYEEGMGGLPVTVTIEKEENERGIETNKLCFWTVESLCDYRCALAHVLSISRGRTKYNSINDNTESLLKIMYDLSYPNGPTLEPAPHYNLLRENGGTIPRENYKSYRYSYVPAQDFVMCPTKSLYQRITVV